MTDSSIGTPAQLRDPNYMPPMAKAIPLGIQHVLAMFVSNVTPAIIVAGAAGFGFGTPDVGNLIYMIQMAILFAGIATLIQTIGVGPIGARLPIVQGTSFAFIPIMIPAVAGAGVAGMGGLMTGVIIGGLFHMILGTFIKKIRFALPPLVTGLIVLMIGLALIKVGIEYAAGGAGDFNRGQADWGGAKNWFIALVVIVVTLGIKFSSKGFMSTAAVLIGLLVGYIIAAMFGMVSLGGVGRASWFALPAPFKFGFEFNFAIIIGMCLMAFISAIETVGDTVGITKGGAGRDATDEEIVGATYADGLGTAIAGVFGSLPNTSFSQNVGLISMTGVMSRGVVTIGAIFLIICGFIPKVGAIISSIPIEVLGGGVIVMFGMVAAAGARMLSDVVWTRRNMIIFAVALSIGLGLQLVPDAMKFLSPTWKILLTSGLLPAAFIAIILNLLLPEDEVDGGHETQLSGLGESTQPGANAGAGARALASASQSVSDGTAVPAAKASLVDAKDAVASGLESVSDATSAAAEKVSLKASEAKSTAKSATKSASQSTKSASSTTKKIVKDAKDDAKSAAKSAKRSTKATAKKAGAKTKAATGKSKNEDVTAINGVGPKIAKILDNHGLGSLAKINAASISELTSAADAAGYAEKSGDYARDWKAQAKALRAKK